MALSAAQNRPLSRHARASARSEADGSVHQRLATLNADLDRTEAAIIALAPELISASAQRLFAACPQVTSIEICVAGEITWCVDEAVTVHGSGNADNALIGASRGAFIMDMVRLGETALQDICGLRAHADGRQVTITLTRDGITMTRSHAT